MSKPTYAVISQTYVPDTPSVGQHMHDAAVDLVGRGYHVVTFAAAAAYDDPSRKFPKREMLDGVDVRRLPMSSFGKQSIKARLAGGMSFTAQVAAALARLPNLVGVLVSTSPPMAPLALALRQRLRPVPFVFWAMDINPDQMIAMGKTTADSREARVFDRMIRSTLQNADRVVALDRFMAERLERKADLTSKLVVMPPWPHESHIEPVAHADNPWRREQGLDGKRVVMYSGNISPAHPLDTLLDAIAQVRDDDRLAFVFIGGGLAKQQIETYAAKHQLTNIRTLPYQPLETLRYSLSAADVHIVAMGDAMVGIVHPCKIYGAMAVARPVLLLGPTRSHAGEILERADCGWQMDHGRTDIAVAALREIAAASEEHLAAMGQRACADQQAHYTDAGLRGQFADTLESVVQ